MKLVNIGFGNFVASGRVVSIVSPESAPIKRVIQEAKDKGNLIDAPQGRKTKSVIFTDSEHIILSYMTVEKIAERFEETDSEEENID